MCSWSARLFRLLEPTTVPRALASPAAQNEMRKSIERRQEGSVDTGALPSVLQLRRRSGSPGQQQNGKGNGNKAAAGNGRGPAKAASPERWVLPRLAAEREEEREVELVGQRRGGGGLGDIFGNILGGGRGNQ